MRLVADPLAQRGQNARLADAGLAREQDDLAFALDCARASGRAAAPPHARARRTASSPRDRDASKRLTFSASRRTAQAGTGASKPFKGLRPKRLQLERRRQAAAVVDSAITTLPGSASACNRAARLGVSPTTACSCAEPCPIKVADDDEAGRDADADLQTVHRPCVEVRDDGGTSPGRPGPPARRRPHGRAESRNRPGRHRP